MTAPVPAVSADPRPEPRPGPVAWLLVGIVRAYQLVVSPWLGPSCRFEPSCSAYAVEAFRTHGAVRGSWLVLRRLGRCQPFCAGGYDPVPERRGHEAGRDLGTGGSTEISPGPRAGDQAGPPVDDVRTGSPDRGVPAC